MATLNYAFKEINCKIVYYGCGLCGKTTNLIHVHKTVPGKFRGELVSLATEQDRTLFFDFLPLDLGEVKGFKTKFQLYTVPGQVYYNATRKLVLRGVDGIVFVVDSQKDRLQENVESFENLRQNLEEYGYKLQTEKNDQDGIPWVLQLNKRDMPQISERDEIVDALGLTGAHLTVVDAVAVTGGGVKETLKGISSLVIQKLNTGQAMPATGAAATPAPAAQAAASAADDEYSEVNEEDLTDEKLSAPEPPKPATPQPKAAAPAPAAPAATPAPAAAKSAAPKVDLFTAQQSSASWRGIKSGSGMLTLAPIEGTNEFQLTGVLSFMGAFKRTFSKKLVLKDKVNKAVNGANHSFHLLESAPEQDGPAVTVLIQDNTEKSLYASYVGFGGEIVVTPVGQKSMPA